MLLSPGNNDMKTTFSVFTLSFCLLSPLNWAFAKPKCRNRPGDTQFPSARDWSKLNSTVEGRLVKAIPTAKFCEGLPGGICTDAQWDSALFRIDNPGSMLSYNFEQDYDSKPPSLCLRNSTTCGQGNVPLYAVKAKSAKDIQAAVKFAHSSNIRVSIKASGHDYLGRSTAKDSLLIFTHALQDIQFHDSFKVRGKDLGSAVTVGSGVPLNTLYQASKAQGKIFVGGTAATVVAAGGYVQGGGHSALSPTFGLAADNALEFKVVVANGDLLTANADKHSDLFWALRGGGAGSWGVIVSATFKTYPTFNLTQATVVITSDSHAELAAIGALHAKHIFDLDKYRAGQYYSMLGPALSNSETGGISNGSSSFIFSTFFPNATISQATTGLKPFHDELKALNISFAFENYTELAVHDALFAADDRQGDNGTAGSRLIPERAYRDAPEAIGEMYKGLLDSGVLGVVGLLVAGGKVAENANIDSAIHPGWRTAKVHLVIINGWSEASSLKEIRTISRSFQNKQLPIIEKLIGNGGASYSNEADYLEPNFQNTFFGPKYFRLNQIKKRYDPEDLFIVRAGVGSERWDQDGLCMV